MNNIEYQFEYLTHALRMQLECIVKYPRLIQLDEHEAIFNIEIIVKSVLDAFHNIYDAIQKLSGKSIDFYSEPELHFILSLRNAKHHNADLTSLFFIEQDIFFADYRYDNSYPILIYPVKWIDISNYIKSEKKGLAKYPNIENYLDINKVITDAQKHGFTENDIFINIIPFMMKAGNKLVTLSHQYIPTQLNSSEARTFLEHFKEFDKPFNLFTTKNYNKATYLNDINNIIQDSENTLKSISNTDEAPYLSETL